MNKIFNYPNSEEPIFSVMENGSIKYYENLSVMDYQDIIEGMAKGMSEYHKMLGKLFEATAKIESN